MPTPRSPRSGHALNGNGTTPALDRILAKLKNVSRTTNGWQACCPSHNDHSPSLSISVGDDGRILLHCHAVCKFDDIVAALDMHPADLAPGNTAQSTALMSRKPGGLSERLKCLSALKGRTNGTNGIQALESLSASEKTDLLKGVGKRAIKQVRDDMNRPTPFPLDVFPKALKRLIDETANSLPCPPDYIALATLVVTGSFVGSGRPLQVKPGWEERAVIFGVTVGHTGSRKTPALEKGMAPARKRDEQLSSEHKIAKQDYESARQVAKKDKREFTDPPPIERQHVTTDTTVEALADVLNWNPHGLLVYRDEASGWVASLNQYKGGSGSDRQFWLSAWSSQDYTVNRKGKEPQRITRPFLSVIGNIPPDMLGELADRRGRQDGFIDRILFAFPDPVQVKWTDTSPDPELESAYIEACLRIGKIPDALLRLTRAAQAEFATWYDEHNRSTDGPSGSWAKMDGYCVRLASIIHHLRYAYREVKSRDEVDVVSVRSAIDLIDYFKNHARRALGRMKAGREGKGLARLLAFVVNAPKHQVRPRALIGAQIAGTAEEAKSMLQQLAIQGLGQMVRGRRKDEIIFQGRDDIDEVCGQFEEGESA